MPKPNDVGVGTAILLINNKCAVLLGMRKGAHRANTWSCPGGWIDRSDTSTDLAIIREVEEEVGLVVDEVEHLCWITEDHPEIACRSITLYHVAWVGMWYGEPEVMEPDKCVEWRWFPLDDLPSPLFPGIQDAVTQLLRKRPTLYDALERIRDDNQV